MTPEARNVAASIHARLLRGAHEREEDFQFILQRYAAERFLYRLGLSRHRDRLVLKGAMLYALWGGSLYRPTRDLDFTGYGSNETVAVLRSVREICAVPTPDNDGLRFHLDTLDALPTRGDAEYDGLRIRFDASLGTARINMQIDIGFGNAIEPPAEQVAYPTLLDSPPPHILAYPHEGVIAEKLYYAVRFGERNSRLKDFYDLYVLGTQFSFDGNRLAQATAATFERRLAPIDDPIPAALTTRFYADPSRARQWRGYLTRNSLPGAPADFAVVGETLGSFLEPLWRALAVGRPFDETWEPGGPWGPSPVEPSVLQPSSTSQQHSEASPPSALTEAVGATRQRRQEAVHRFRPYRAYKASGVEPLGEIPRHWKALKLKRICKFAYGDSLAATDRAKGDVKVYGSNGPVGTHNRANTQGPCLLIGRKGSFGKVNFSSDAVFAIDTTFFVDGRTTSVNMRWLYYLLVGAALDSQSKDSAIPGLDREDAYAKDVAVCGTKEQLAIAGFLDSETAKIDALVAKKERLIELLEEKRSALIAQVTTKGFNPNVPTKRTENPRFPSVAQDWVLRKLRRLITRVSRPVRVQPGNLYREIGTRSWGKGIFHKDSVPGTQLGEKKVFYVKPSDLVLNIIFAWEGAVAVVSQREDGMIASHRFPTFRHDGDQVDLDYLLMFLQSEHGRALMALNSPGAAGRNRTIRIGSFLDEEIPLPPLPTQQEIVRGFRDQEELLRALGAQIRTLDDYLSELRTAVISAAVTGKIDVREEVS